MLHLDRFCGHMTERVKAEVNEDSIRLLIPAGITKLLHPFDVVTNLPLKVACWQL
jgi:hypothetical protein